VRRALHADRLCNTPQGLAAALRGIGTGAMAPLWDRLGELAMPVTLAAGEHDAKFLALARRMAARSPRAAVAVVSGSGHAAHLEAPAAVAGLL
jgi:2-succinyl-6-hydroxy-2,4-cyclohexadiene-1-carboxylate synthase